MSAARASVIVVHGLWLPGIETVLLRHRFRKAGFDVYLFRYRTVADDLAANAALLARFIATVPGDTVHLVGHSLGGVLIVEMLARYPLNCGGRAVCLGSPLAGSRAATALCGWPGGRRIVGKSVGDVLARGGLASCGNAREVGIVAGSLPFGFGRLLGGLPKTKDGTVAVEETRLPGAADHIVLSVSDFALVWSAAVFRQTLAFLHDGHFSHD
jgi:pimeloyl-ACP methyl ester carboxylesterase